MKVELWEDVICSWCGIANGRVQRALTQFGHEQEVEFVHRSFRMMPTMPEGQSIGFTEYIGAQAGLPQEQMQQMAHRVQEIARKDGIESYHVLDNAVGNTTLAHEFLAWASEQGKQNEAWEMLFHAHFGEKADLWTTEDLVPVAQRLDLDAGDAHNALETRKYRTQVENDHNEAVALGARGVPFLVIDRRYCISGAQSVGTLLGALQKAWSERDLATA